MEAGVDGFDAAVTVGERSTGEVSVPCGTKEMIDEGHTWGGYSVASAAQRRSNRLRRKVRGDRWDGTGGEDRVCDLRLGHLE